VRVIDASQVSVRCGNLPSHLAHCMELVHAGVGDTPMSKYLNRGNARVGSNPWGMLTESNPSSTFSIGHEITLQHAYEPL